MTILAPMRPKNQHPTTIQLRVQGLEPIRLTPSTHSALAVFAASRGHASTADLTASDVKDFAQGARPKRGDLVTCDAPGCVSYGKERHRRSMLGQVSHFAKHINRDDYSLGLRKNNDDPWHVGMYIADNGTGLKLETTKQLAEDLTILTALAEQLNAAA